MKFFDYKFLILLGLTLVVYFIYREVEYIRSKLEKMEKEMKERIEKIQYKEPVNKPLEIENKEPTLKQLELVEKQPEIKVPVSSLETKEPSPKPNQKVINLDMTGLNLNPNLINSNIGIKLNQINESETEDSDEEITSIQSDSSKHLAIYSNDNEQFDETQNSLLESVEANKKEIIFQYGNKMEIPQIKTNIDDLMNSISSEENKQSDKPVKIDSEKSEISVKSNVSQKSTKSNISQKSNKSDKTNKKFNETELNEKKLPEIKKIAESLNITLSKKVNGQVRLKNKNELIMEILAK